jgi:hypothetical protein
MTEIEVTGLLLKLADFGVTGIKISYEGGGDSGSIEHIGYGTDKYDSVNDVADELDTWGGESLEKLVSNDVYRQLETFAYEKLLDNVEDWYNNDGGYGEISILVPSGEYQINNNIRITHTESYIHEGSMINKSIE